MKKKIIKRHIITMPEYQYPTEEENRLCIGQKTCGRCGDIISSAFMWAGRVKRRFTVRNVGGVMVRVWVKKNGLVEEEHAPVSEQYACCDKCFVKDMYSDDEIRAEREDYE